MGKILKLFFTLLLGGGIAIGGILDIPLFQSNSKESTPLFEGNISLPPKVLKGVNLTATGEPKKEKNRSVAGGALEKNGSGEENGTGEENQTVDSLTLQITQLEKELNKSEFYLNYQAYITYKKLSAKVEKLKKLAKRNKKKYWDDYISAKEKLQALTPQTNLFDSLIKLTHIEPPPHITNPFQIFEVLGYEKQLKEKLAENERYYQNFLETYNMIKFLYQLKVSKGEKDPYLEQAITDFELTNEVYKSKLKELETQGKNYLLQAKKEVEGQINKLINLAIMIGISLIIFFIFKLLIKKYVKDESAYLINKVLNFINITIILILIFATYMENTSYFMTFLGFASAGIAIAMKDWFMNMFGWFVIMVSGNFKVGDRIKIVLQNGNVQIVGDVIDITLNRIVIYEDVTFTTYTRLRRAGRIVFVPNNIIFNNPIYNYTHHGLNTVWDGIDIVLTFDSNFEKAEQIAKEVLTRYAKPFCDMTKKKVDKLRLEYNVRNINLEPRLFTFIENYGIKLTIWYLAPYAPMRLRSKISKELLKRFLQEPDIKIAYPTTENIIHTPSNSPFSFGNPPSTPDFSPPANPYPPTPKG
jgi:small-conductance mechanosensitive channel